MSGVVRLQSLRIDRMPGIRPPGFNLPDMSPGVNVLFGPNGSGKTSVGRATILALFGGAESVWHRMAPGAADDKSRDRRLVQFEAALEASGDDGTPLSWRVRVDGTWVETLINGHPDTLSAGTPDLAQRYRMGLAELLVESNDEFAREILRQAAGGIDLDNVTRSLHWDKAVPKPRIHRGSPVSIARRECAEARRKQAILDGEAARAEELRKREKSLRDQLALARLIDEAIACLEARDRVRELTEQLEQLSDIARRVDPAALATIENLETQLTLAKSQLDGASRAQASHQNSPEPLSPDEIRMRGVGLEDAHGCVASLRTAEKELNAAETAHAEAKARRDEAESQLCAGGIRETDPTDRVDLQAARDADEIAELVRTARNSRSQLQDLRRQFAESGWMDGVGGRDVPGQEELRRMLEALADWCKAADQATPAGSERPRESASVPRWMSPAIVVLGILIVAASLALHLAAAIGLAAVALAAWLAWRAGPSNSGVATAPSTAGDARERYLRAASGCGYRVPAEWTTSSAVDLIDELVSLLAARAKLEAARPIQVRFKDLENQAGDAEKNVIEACRKFAGTHRMDVARDGQMPAEGWMPVLVRTLTSYRNAVEDVRETEARLSLAQRELGRRTDVLREALQQVGVDIRTDAEAFGADTAATLLESLKRRRESYAAFVKQGVDVDEKVAEATKRHREADGAVARFWKDLGLVRGDRRGLQALLDDQKRFRGLWNDREAANAQERDRRSKLAGRQDLLQRGLDGLRQAQLSHPEVEENLKAVMREVGDIDGQVRRARESHDVSIKEHAYRMAHEELAQQERAWLTSQVRKEVVSWARDNMRRSVVAPVVARARRLLAAFTRGQLDFEVRADRDGKAPTLIARSGDSDAWRTVDRLSSGERIQLLMAIRLAFLEESESRVLPIFLDEVLGSSDDERARHIIDAVVAIARSGRQVFYATAQADEVAKWNSRLRESGVPHRVIDFSVARNLRKLEAFPLPEPLPAREPPPPAAGQTHAEYGKALRVPGVDWSEPGLASLHPWHVIEDPQVLHEALRQGLLTMEQVERVAVIETAGPLAAARDSIRAAACAYRAAAEARRIGRGKALSRATLEVVDGVSSTFREKIWEIARQVDCDAAALLRELRENRPKNWHQANTDKVEVWLRSEGYLVDEDQLGPEEIMARVAEELARMSLRESVTPTTIHRLRGLLAGR